MLRHVLVDEALSAFVDDFTDLLTRTESRSESKEECVVATWVEQRPGFDWSLHIDPSLKNV
jgi:hypothetical protein